MKKQTTGVYLIKDNKILFLIRNKKNDTMHRSGIYLSIGGHVEVGEGIEEAAIREVKEESGKVELRITRRGDRQPKRIRREDTRKRQELCPQITQIFAD